MRCQVLFWEQQRSFRLTSTKNMSSYHLSHLTLLHVVNRTRAPGSGNTRLVVQLSRYLQIYIIWCNCTQDTCFFFCCCLISTEYQLFLVQFFGPFTWLPTSVKSHARRIMVQVRWGVQRTLCRVAVPDSAWPTTLLALGPVSPTFWAPASMYASIPITPREECSHTRNGMRSRPNFVFKKNNGIFFFFP